MLEIPLPYDHGRKAGNLGDVWKHAVLVSIAAHVEASRPFTYVESHSGAPTYRLAENGEWRRGIRVVLDRAADNVHPYLGLARNCVSSGRYEAGWRFFSRVLAARAPKVSVILCDTSPVVAVAYETSSLGSYGTNVKVTFHSGDGYAFVQNASADLVFLDPPYSPDAETDWKALATTCRALRDRGVPFLAWYPFYWPSKPQRLVDATREAAWEVAWAPCGQKPSQNLKGCGVLVSGSLVPVMELAQAELGAIADCINRTGAIVHRVPSGRPANRTLQPSNGA